MSERSETVWAAATAVLCVLVMLGLAFTGLLALAGVLVVLLVSFGCRWMIVRLAALPRRDRSRGE